MSSLALGVYRLAAAALAPLAARRLARDGADPARQGERHGRVPERRGELWLHAASVGELNAAEPLLRALLARVPEARIVVSTLTATGAAECARRFSGKDRLRHLYAPLDSRRRVVRWLDATRPARLLLVETELWPELLHQCHARSIPVALVNARLSDRAFPRYLRMRRLITPVLRQVHPVLCQTDDDARRYIALGASADSVHVCGNLKLDRDALPEPSARVREWMAPAQQRPIWVAGSTHPGEEELLAKAHMDLIAKLPDALLICVPRHPNRSAETLNIMRSAGLNAGLIDQFPEQPALSAVVVDQLGVLTELYQLADCCFVGGSLVPGIGGHNLFEPALAGRPVVSGPWTESQREVATAMIKAGALQETRSADELEKAVTTLLTDKSIRAARGKRALTWASSQRGALKRTWDWL